MNKWAKEHILQALSKGIRFDGRKAEDFREISVEIGVSKSAEGSARVKIGDTEVIAGIKMGVETPYPDTPLSQFETHSIQFSLRRAPP